MYKVLIVDDLKMNRILIKKNLSSLRECEFIEAADGNEALALLSETEVDLVLLDLMMPELDGFGVLQAKLEDERIRHIPVVVQSLLDDEESIHRALELGAYDYFVRLQDGGAFRRDLVLKSRNAISAYQSYKAASKELAERKTAEQRLAMSRRRRHLSDLFSGFLAGRVASNQLVRQIQLYGNPLEPPVRIYLIEIESKDRAKRKELQENPADWQALEDAMQDLLENTGTRPIWPEDNHLTILAAAESPQEKMECWKTVVETAMPGLKVILAASDSCRNWNETALSHRHACDALLAARTIPGYGGQAVYENIGIDRLLAPLAGGRDSDTYVRCTLQALIDYDSKHNSELIRTLEAMLFSADLNEAAEILGIHLKTLQFRRSRIEKILNVNPKKAETRVDLTVALRLLRLGQKLGY